MNDNQQPPNRLYAIRPSHLDPSQPRSAISLQHVITGIVTKHGYQIKQPDLNLCITQTAKNLCLLVMALNDDTILIARMFKAFGYWLESVLILIYMDPAGWQPMGIRYSEMIWEEYTQSEMCTVGNADLSIFDEMIEFITQKIMAEHWLEEGMLVRENINAVMATWLNTIDVNRTSDSCTDIME
ncbi:MAG: hypothetical protein R3E39_06655 [Anaerolineae bacterium]